MQLVQIQAKIIITYALRSAISIQINLCHAFNSLGSDVSIPMFQPFTKIKTDMKVQAVQAGIYNLGILIEPKEFTKVSIVEDKIV